MQNQDFVHEEDPCAERGELFDGVATPMTANLIDKQKLIQRLKQARANVVDEENQMRFMYQTGRNILVDVLLAEIAFGDLDANNEGK